MALWDDTVDVATDAWSRMQERWFRKRTGYRHLFYADDMRTLNAPAEVVLADLASFCRAFESTAVYSPITGSLDPLASAKADGRREVYLRIVAFLRADEAQISRMRQHQEAA